LPRTRTVEGAAADNETGGAGAPPESATGRAGACGPAHARKIAAHGRAPFDKTRAHTVDYYMPSRLSSPIPPHSQSSIVQFDPTGPRAMDDIGSQLLWLATQRRTWRSLAVVGASEGVPTIEIANMFAKLAWWYRGQASSVADFRDLSLRLVDYQLRDVAAQLERESITIVIALRSIFENPTVVPVASVADAAILCVKLGATKIKHARRTVETIGRDRFIGTIVLRDGAGGKGSQRPSDRPNGPPPPRGRGP
jgi:hypothetical protein